MLLRDIFEDTLSPTMILAQAIMEAVGKGKTLPMGWKSVSRYLKPEERDQLRSDTAQRLVDVFRSLPSEKEFEASARAGQAKKGWYAASAKALMDVFGPDTPRFTAVLASLSPQVSVTENLRNAIKFWERWIEAGRPETDKGIDEVGEAAVGAERWHKMGWKNNVSKAVKHPQPEKVTLSSGGTEANPKAGKVDSFRANLLGDLSRVTNDAWMAHFADIDQQLFSSKAGYLAMTARVRKVAEKMGWQPAEVQETVWSFFKALHESQSIESKGRKALEKLTHKDVNDSADFADLMAADDEVRNALQRLRDRGLVGTASKDLRDGGQGPEGSPHGLAAQAGLAGSLARVADRAENLKHRQDVQELSTEGYHFPNATDVKFGRRHVTFTLTDPREIAEWKEKTRKGTDSYSVILGRRDGKWDLVRGVVHGTPTVDDDGKRVVITLPYTAKEVIKPAEIDPERWRYVERKKQEKADKFRQATKTLPASSSSTALAATE